MNIEQLEEQFVDTSKYPKQKQKQKKAKTKPPVIRQQFNNTNVEKEMNSETQTTQQATPMQEECGADSKQSAADLSKRIIQCVNDMKSGVVVKDHYVKPMAIAAIEYQAILDSPDGVVITAENTADMFSIMLKLAHWVKKPDNQILLHGLKDLGKEKIFQMIFDHMVKNADFSLKGIKTAMVETLPQVMTEGSIKIPITVALQMNEVLNYRIDLMYIYRNLTPEWFMDHKEIIKDLYGDLVIAEDLDFDYFFEVVCLTMSGMKKASQPAKPIGLNAFAGLMKNVFNIPDIQHS